MKKFTDIDFNNLTTDDLLLLGVSLITLILSGIAFYCACLMAPIFVVLMFFVASYGLIWLMLLVYLYNR